MFNNYSEVQKMEKISKKELIREIIATPTKTGGEFDVRSLERENIKNLQLILNILNA
jgi:tyrosine-protein phosphatase YwqE